MHLRMHLRMLDRMNMHMNDSPVTYVDIKTFAAMRAVNPRTVNNWLAAKRLDGARKIDGKWAIPDGAQPTDPPAVITTAAAVAQAPEPADVGTVPPVGGGGFRPKYRPVPIDAVAREYAVPADTIRRWARDPDVPGMHLLSGPHAAHYVWIEAAG